MLHAKNIRVNINHKHEWTLYEDNFNVKNTFNNEKLICLIEIQRRKHIDVQCNFNEYPHGHVEV
jgi:hypothetical protein